MLTAVKFLKTVYKHHIRIVLKWDWGFLAQWQSACPAYPAPETGPQLHAHACTSREHRFSLPYIHSGLCKQTLQFHHFILRQDSAGPKKRNQVMFKYLVQEQISAFSVPKTFAFTSFSLCIYSYKVQKSNIFPAITFVFNFSKCSIAP